MTIWTDNRATGTGAFEAARAYAARINAAMMALDEALRVWIGARRLQRLDDAALKDIGVARGGIGWVASNGRNERR